LKEEGALGLGTANKVEEKQERGPVWKNEKRRGANKPCKEKGKGDFRGEPRGVVKGGGTHI